MDLAYKDRYDKLGLNIAYYRKLAKLTQLELSEMVNIDPSHISKIELGNIGVSLDVLFRIADTLKIPVHKLLEFRD